jgi:hypothetical protein
MAVPIRTMKVDGELLDAKVQDNVIGGEIVRSMDGSSRLTIEVDDPDRVLLESGVLARAKRGRVRQGLELAAWQRIGKVQLSWEGTFWRLAGAPFTGSTTKLEWEPEVVVRLRRQTKHTKTSRNRQYSVLDFMSRLFHMGDVPATFVTSRLEELAVADVDEREVEGRRRGLRVGERVPGKDGYPLTPDQIRNANRALRTAAKLGAGERATLALIEACLIEAPNFSNPVGGDSSSVGILQLLDTHLGGSTSANGGRRDIELVVTMFLEDGFTGRGGAMQLARENPSWEPGRIAQACQGSAYPDRYEAQRANADRILEMFGGVGGTVVTRRQYVFHAGTRGDQEEDYFEAVQRLAREVRIRAFESGGRFWVGKDADFLARMPITTLVERWKQGDPLGTYQVGEFSDGQWDYGERAASLSFSAALPDDRDRRGVESRESRWSFAPGHVMDVRRMGPYTGRWLVEEIRQGIADEVAEFQLTKPGPLKPQPAPDMQRVDAPDPESEPFQRIASAFGGAKGLVDAAVDIAEEVAGDVLFVISAYRPGDPLDHGSNDSTRAARDIARIGVDALVGPPSPALDRAVVQIGKAFGRSYGSGTSVIIDTFSWKGYRTQIIWRTPLYGGHMGHIHIGVRRE